MSDFDNITCPECGVHGEDKIYAYWKMYEYGQEPQDYDYLEICCICIECDNDWWLYRYELDELSRNNPLTDGE